MQLYNLGCVFFAQHDEMPGNETLGITNHCYTIMQYDGGVMYYNSAPGGAVTRFKKTNLDLTQLQKAIAEGPPEICAPRPADNFLENWPYNKRLSVYDNMPQPELTPVEKFPYTNVTNSLEDRLFFYKTIDRYIKFLKPTFVVEVGVFKAPGQDFFYGRPMFCHNFIIQLLGIQIGNILTSLHLKNRLLDWSGKTNFYAELIHEQKNPI